MRSLLIGKRAYLSGDSVRAAPFRFSALDIRILGTSTRERCNETILHFCLPISNAPAIAPSRQTRFFPYPSERTFSNLILFHLEQFHWAFSATATERLTSALFLFQFLSRPPSLALGFHCSVFHFIFSHATYPYTWHAEVAAPKPTAEAPIRPLI